MLRRILLAVVLLGAGYLAGSVISHQPIHSQPPPFDPTPEVGRHYVIRGKRGPLGRTVTAVTPLCVTYRCDRPGCEKEHYCEPRTFVRWAKGGAR